MTRDKVVTAIFTDTVPVTVTMSAAKYDYGETMVVRVRDGTANGEVMIQVNLNAAVKWADQKTLDFSGSLDYSIKVPSTWGEGAFTVRVKDVEGGTGASAAYTVPRTTPTPPPPPPSGGGGGEREERKEKEPKEDGR